MGYLRAWRQHRGLSQTDLAELARTTKATISRLESGQTRWTQEMLERLAAALNITQADLLFIHPEKPSDFLVELVRESPAARHGFGTLVFHFVQAFDVDSLAPNKALDEKQLGRPRRRR